MVGKTGRLVVHVLGLVLMVTALVGSTGGGNVAAQPSVCVSIHGDLKTKQGAQFPAGGGSECPSDADSRAIAVNGSIASAKDGSHAVAINGSFVVATTDSHGLGVNGSGVIATDSSTARGINSGGVSAINDSTVTAVNGSDAIAKDGSTAMAINGCDGSSAVHANNGATKRAVNCP